MIGVCQSPKLQSMSLPCSTFCATTNLWDGDEKRQEKKESELTFRWWWLLQVKHSAPKWSDCTCRQLQWQWNSRATFTDDFQSNQPQHNRLSHRQTAFWQQRKTKKKKKTGVCVVPSMCKVCVCLCERSLFLSHYGSRWNGMDIITIHLSILFLLFPFQSSVLIGQRRHLCSITVALS